MKNWKILTPSFLALWDPGVCVCGGVLSFFLFFFPENVLSCVGVFQGENKKFKVLNFWI